MPNGTVLGKVREKEAHLTPYQVLFIHQSHKPGGREMAVEKTIGSTSLAEVIDRILDKGIVVRNGTFAVRWLVLNCWRSKLVSSWPV